MAEFHKLECINRKRKVALLKRIWPHLSLTESNFCEDDYTALYDYLREERDIIEQQSWSFAADTLDSILNLIDDIRDSWNSSKTEILAVAQRRFLNADESAILHSVELSIRVWLHLNVRACATTLGPLKIDTTTIEWPDAKPLSELVAERFIVHNNIGTVPNRTRIDATFTASYLQNICGIQIYWTNNLSDHLNFNSKRRVLTIYQHKIRLLNDLQLSTSPPLDRLVLEEAIDTLNLLFPFGDVETRELLAKSNKPFYSLGLCGRNRVLDLSQYPVWGEKLADLILVFHEPPRDLKQLMRDRRNVNNWVNFWIAVLVLLLTLVSIAFGTVSTVYSIKQYELSLAQACSAPGASFHLQRFCG